MLQPTASRPFMPGYGTLRPDEGTGLLPWSWALEKLTASKDYWVSTATSDGWPHCSPVWGVWLADSLWFSCSNGSRKARNLRSNPRCALATCDPEEHVVLYGEAERITDMVEIAKLADCMNAKYQTGMEISFFDPAHNSVFRVALQWAIGLSEADFTGSPTKWSFER